MCWTWHLPSHCCKYIYVIQSSLYIMVPFCVYTILFIQVNCVEPTSNLLFWGFFACVNNVHNQNLSHLIYFYSFIFKFIWRIEKSYSALMKLAQKWKLRKIGSECIKAETIHNILLNPIQSNFFHNHRFFRSNQFNTYSFEK